MNPFKIKTLDDFTYRDCEEYLNRYPYGEHSLEVKKRIKVLKSGLAEVINQTTKFHNSHHKDHIKTGIAKKRDNTNRITKISENNIDVDNNLQDLHNKKKTAGKSTVDAILWWIGAIVVVLIVGTVDICVIDAILPKDTAKYIYKFRYGIYALFLAISKCFDRDKS